jgi:hypothetical protein
MARTRFCAGKRTLLVIAPAIGLAMVLGGCNGDQPQRALSTPTDAAVAPSPTPAATTPAATTPAATASPTPVVTASAKPVVTTTSATAATTSPSPVAAIASAVKRHPDIARDTVVEKVTISRIDPTWAYALASSPTAGGAQAVVHRTGGGWKVVSLGSSEVGCGDGVPAAVMTEFGLECPS